MDKTINHGEFGILNRLPLELWHQILRLLPVKSLVKLSAVNKSFFSLIYHPDLAAFHLQHFPGNHKPRLLNINCYSQPDNGGCFYGVPEFKSFTEVLFTDQQLTWYIAGSINGLLLLVAHHHGTPKANPITMILWNPSIRKHRDLPIPSGMLRTFALGYDRIRNEHKVVTTCEREAWIFNVETDIWTDDVTSDNESGFHRCKYGDPMFYYSDSLSFKDGAVWTQSEYTKLDQFELVWFDFETERFRYANKMEYRKDRRGLMMLDGGCTVGFWGVGVVAGNQVTTSIWALQSDTMTWIKRYEILCKMIPFQVGFETVSFEESDGELVWKYRLPDGKCLEVLRYRLQPKSLWHDQEELSRFDGGYVSFYVESLFLLK